MSLCSTITVQLNVSIYVKPAQQLAGRYVHRHSRGEASLLAVKGVQHQDKADDSSCHVYGLTHKIHTNKCSTRKSLLNSRRIVLNRCSDEHRIETRGSLKHLNTLE